MEEKVFKKAGGILKNGRVNKKLGQSDIAQKLGTDPSHWSRWENGVHKPSKSYLIQICDILDLDLKKLQRTYREAKYEYMLGQEPTQVEDIEISNILKSTASTLNSLDLSSTVKIALLQSLQDQISKAITKLKEETNGS